MPLSPLCSLSICGFDWRSSTAENNLPRGPLGLSLLPRRSVSGASLAEAAVSFFLVPCLRSRSLRPANCDGVAPSPGIFPGHLGCDRLDTETPAPTPRLSCSLWFCGSSLWKPDAVLCKAVPAPACGTRSPHRCAVAATSASALGHGTLKVEAVPFWKSDF